ncbi:Forkhead box protein I1-ema [Leucoagaricus sp. SymC.cos]|nr:Forkhead box protein I1-ema [Leucoagaricus sp. SymC.cos]
MFAHQYTFPLAPIDNNVSEHNYSSPEGSDSAFGSLAVNDEPFLPARHQQHQQVHPSPLNYSVAPEFIPGQLENNVGQRNFSGGINDNAFGPPAYASQYRQPITYTSNEVYDFSQHDDPYVPPGFYHPPPLAAQTQHHFMYQQHAQQQFSIRAPQPLPQHPPIAPQVQRDLPNSPSISSSSSDDASLGQSYTGHQEMSSPPSLSDATPQRMSEPVQMSPIPQGHGDGGSGGRAGSEPPADDAEAPPERPEPSQHWLDTDKYLRNQIGIPEGTKADLWALPDPPPGQKPQQPLPILVKLAIHGSPRGMLTLQEIYLALEDRFDYFARLKSSAWKNSIRHNLSLNQVFRSCDRPITEPGKGRYWSLDISKGEGYKRERRRKRRNAAPYNGTRDLPGGIGNQLNPDSSDGDQDMEDDTEGGKVNKSKKGRKRGPYTKITIPQQPSIPGTTGITIGGAAAAALVEAHWKGNSPVPGSGPSPVSTTPTHPHPVAQQQPQPSGYTPMTEAGMAFDPAVPASAPAGPSTSASVSRPTLIHSHSQPGLSTESPSSLVPQSSHMHGHSRGHATTLPYPITLFHHQGMYFNRAPAPTFGQPSLPAPGSFAGMTSTSTSSNAAFGGGDVRGMVGGVPPHLQHTLRGVGGTVLNVGGEDGDAHSAISISSESDSDMSPPMSERMVGGPSYGGRTSG